MRIILWIGILVIALGCTQPQYPLANDIISDGNGMPGPEVNETHLLNETPENNESEEILDEDEPEEVTVYENETIETTENEMNTTEEDFCTEEQEQACEAACDTDPESQACFYECILLVGCD